MAFVCTCVRKKNTKQHHHTFHLYQIKIWIIEQKPKHRWANRETKTQWPPHRNMENRDKQQWTDIVSELLTSNIFKEHILSVFMCIYGWSHGLHCCSGEASLQRKIMLTGIWCNVLFLICFSKCGQPLVECNMTVCHCSIHQHWLYTKRSYLTETRYLSVKKTNILYNHIKITVFDK